ncbi:hypothetical protein SBRCBS47491_008288 [Sporothrix bragantina]|uniref:Yeast cell wall synthesis Kre9/Knh1-like N-terminal domain-containing protein n=1 Tax=Sporothrix bragantina TaxID=671064 RepID=A0ABP0CN91_9PEZI
MRFTAATLVAFASAVLAQTANFDVISQPTEGSVVPAGETYTIVWAPTADYNNDTITLTLLGGATSKTLQQVSVIKAGVASSAGKYEWAVASSLGADATYGIEITLDSDPSILEYSFPFTISGGKTGSSSGGAASTGSASAETSATATSTSTKKTSSSSSSTKAASSTTVTTSSSSSSAPTTLATLTSTTAAGNTTVTKPSASKTVVTNTQTATKSGSAATGTASTVSTSGAKAVGAGSFVTLVGGLAVAFFAL